MAKGTEVWLKAYDQEGLRNITIKIPTRDSLCASQDSQRMSAEKLSDYQSDVKRYVKRVTSLRVL
jgi:hypothetical protein